MTANYPEREYSNFMIALLLAFPVLINSVKIFGNLILFIFVILGVYISISEKKNPFQMPELKLFSWLMVGYFGVMLFSMLVADGLNAEFYHLGRKLHFLLAPFIALALFQIDLPLKRLLLSLKFGLIIIGIIALVYSLGFTEKISMININIFGDITVAMLFLSIVQVFKETPKERIITFIAVLLGGYALFLSSSRGSWVSFIILSIIYIGLIYKPFLQSGKSKLSLVLLLAIFLGFISTNSKIQARVSQTITAVQNWDSESKTITSAGERLNMWVTGLKATQDSPWLGRGYRNANDAAQKYTAQDIGYTHLHNEYITSLVSAGVIGLLALLTLLFTPMVIFYKQLNNNKNYHYALMGVLLCVGYTTFGFTHIALGEEHINAFYVLFMGFLLPKMMRGH